VLSAVSEIKEQLYENQLALLVTFFVWILPNCVSYPLYTCHDKQGWRFQGLALTFGACQENCCFFINLC
jgi:hypothetical protein